MYSSTRVLQGRIKGQTAGGAVPQGRVRRDRPHADVSQQHGLSGAAVRLALHAKLAKPRLRHIRVEVMLHRPADQATELPVFTAA